jgi:hypothetical protein
MQDAKPIDTPLPKGVKFVPVQGNPINPSGYAQAIGSLMYTALGTWPDIAFAVQQLSQFSATPTADHWTGIKCIFRYLQGTKSAGITYKKADELPVLKMYSDSDFANSADTKSISGNICIMSSGAISWMSKKQMTTTQSTVEAEYMTFTPAAKQITWLHCLLNGIGISQTTPMHMLSDNLVAISISHKPIFHTHTKHINVQYHYIREAISN